MNDYEELPEGTIHFGYRDEYGDHYIAAPASTEVRAWQGGKAYRTTVNVVEEFLGHDTSWAKSITINTRKD